MEDWTGRLKSRRREIVARLNQIGAVPHPGTVGASERPDLLKEIISIEQILSQVELTTAMQRDADQRENQKLDHDHASYWSRRFYTSLAIGNGAGFALVTAALLQSSQLDQALVFAWLPMSFFGPGLLAAGILPFMFWLQRNQKIGILAPLAEFLAPGVATVSAGLFCAAIFSAMITVNDAQSTAGQLAMAQRAVEGAELAAKVKALEATSVQISAVEKRPAEAKP